VQVIRALNKLQRKLEEGNNFIAIQADSGDIDKYTCRFYPPASEEEIMLLRYTFGVSFPSQYESFLSETNGCTLFDHPRYGGENIIYDIYRVINEREIYNDDHSDRVRIAYIYQDNVVIDLKEYHSGSEHYMYVCDCYAPLDECMPLNCSFEEWFDGFIRENGRKYWWDI